MEFSKPILVISRCIEFEAVRYDGGMIKSPFVEQLLPHIDPVTVCPEFDIGLGVPRDTLRLVRNKGRVSLMQPSTGRDLTAKMIAFTQIFLDELGDVDGFIMKSRSPSSALRDANIYDGINTASIIGRGSGLFGNEVLKRFSHLAVEDEGRLRNDRIREHFLRKLFTLSRFREVREQGDINVLIKFHTHNKLLLQSYNQKKLKIMAKIVANLNKQPFKDLLSRYTGHIYSALRKSASYNSNINVLLHALGYFSDNLSGDEKGFFLDSLHRYREGKVPLTSPVNIIKSWIIRFDEQYLKHQTYFNPYPEELMTMETVLACGERDYWN
jgi:uncharacterized protein YbgA (DUF1722 family)/uncharacterized protein YbbK (DUF523 family)